MIDMKERTRWPKVYQGPTGDFLCLDHLEGAPNEATTSIIPPKEIRVNGETWVLVPPHYIAQYEALGIKQLCETCEQKEVTR